MCQGQDAFTLIRLQHRCLTSKTACASKRRVPTGLCHITYVIPFPVSPTGKQTVALKRWIFQIRKKTSSSSLHWRFMEAEESQILEQRTSKKQLLTPRGYKISICEVVCYHQQEPGAQWTVTDTISSILPKAQKRHWLSHLNTQKCSGVWVHMWLHELMKCVRGCK